MFRSQSGDLWKDGMCFAVVCLLFNCGKLGRTWGLKEKDGENNDEYKPFGQVALALSNRPF